ncbi:hypothetical protein AGDE_08378 [Angomonas deanei]|uniref:R3H-associated N-terminal domain containing protein, putative n=1 Tax=Angomonas deanei TaxID=59799 RepID=A0A7G2CAK8_9TRYP|nr:hypothetical protein AGDE_08378 [Angomonas deanei]CAD2215793.1 R3H-associated N-terminal domain containing protein, putative [Angomonas deanei]|eukprot:EPY33048.1 hypothetical protein AGDE_08378 [Angomonas deanei]
MSDMDKEVLLDMTAPKPKFTVVNTKKPSAISDGDKKAQNEISALHESGEPFTPTKSDTGSREREGSFSDNSGTPPLAPRTNPVPLITPRYQKKSRTNRKMEITDTTPERHTPHSALHDQRTETLTITNGPQSYEQTMHFHTYDVYKHGKHHIYSRSVGYSSDGDLVMTREDVSEPSDVDMGIVRKTTELSDPTVLDPRARRPLTDSEAASKKPKHLNRPRFKKYPGLHAPRNRKLRNRLHNDFFSFGIGREILEKARQYREENGDDDDVELPPSFADLPQEVLDTFDLEGEEQEKAMERLGIAPRIYNKTAPVVALDVDSADYRFHLLNSRLRGELQHAFSSDFLSAEIEDLEANFVQFIKDGPSEESLCFYFKDGYGRLVCHGVATYYQLVSSSKMSEDGNHKYTFVAFPKSKKKSAKEINLPHVPLIRVLRGKSRNLPGKHILSADNTPVQAPQDPESQPMSPLDLGTSTGEGQFPFHAYNDTVQHTVGGKLVETVTLETYVPKLKLDLNDFPSLAGENETV